MVLQGLTEGGVSGLITDLVLLLVGEEYNTEKGRVPTPRKCLSSMFFCIIFFSFSIFFAMFALNSRDKLLILLFGAVAASEKKE